MSLPYEMISLDLDLTFLDPQHRISPRNLAAVTRCRDLGVKVVITSGRMFYTTLPYASALGLETPIISYNGAFIKRVSTGEILLDECLDLSTTREIIDLAEAGNMQLNYYLDDTLYSKCNTTWSDLYAARTGAIVNVIGDLRTLADRRPTKLLIVDDPARISRLLEELAPRFAGRVYLTISNAEYLEFIPPGVDKGRALAVVADYYGIPRERVIAFGDAGNDMPAIAWAGLGVAMANARPEVIAIADEVAPRYDEDGVARVLEQIFELPEAIASPCAASANG